MSLVTQLLDMGFSQVRAEKAVKNVKTQTLDAAIDWLQAHEGDADIDEPPKEESSIEIHDEKDDGAAEAPAEAKSLVCGDCGKVFRNMAEAEFHAAKTEHQNFSESTEEKKPLTPEERKAQTEKLQALIAQKKAAREAGEAAEKLEKEKHRRKEGQSVADIRQKQKDKEILEHLAQRKREKEMDKLAKQRVLEQIALDKANRAGNAPVSVAAAPSVVAAPPKIDYDEANIQIRLLDGSTMTHKFGAEEQLAAVRVFVQLNRTDGSEEDFQFMTPFPRKVFNDADMEAPISKLGLVPKAVLVCTKKNPTY